MGKNILGGNKGKKGARKHQQSSVTQRATRKAKEEGEIYGVVSRIHGGCHCEVKCVDKETRLCVIRNKFRGRGKRDNTLTIGVWVLIGTREWETPAEGKLPKCDLLEVYTSTDKSKLKAVERSIDWSQLAGIGNDHEGGSEEEIEFVEGNISKNIMEEDEDSDEYENSNTIQFTSETIDIDDI